MRHKKELKKLTKQLFPAWQYRLYERMHCRKTLYKDMLYYWNEHPDSSLEDIKQKFCADIDQTPNEHLIHNLKRQKLLFFLCLIIVIILCAVLIVFSSSWDAPTTQL